MGLGPAIRQCHGLSQTWPSPPLAADLCPGNLQSLLAIYCSFWRLNTLISRIIALNVFNSFEYLTVTRSLWVGWEGGITERTLCFGLWFSLSEQLCGADLFMP